MRSGEGLGPRINQQEAAMKGLNGLLEIYDGEAIFTAIGRGFRLQLEHHVMEGCQHPQVAFHFHVVRAKNLHDMV
jgi:hypothetical protein